jgi:hypothetical protein
MSYRGRAKCGCPIWDEGCIHNANCRTVPLLLPRSQQDLGGGADGQVEGGDKAGEG